MNFSLRTKMFCCRLLVFVVMISTSYVMCQFRPFKNESLVKDLCKPRNSGNPALYKGVVECWEGYISKAVLKWMYDCVPRNFYEQFNINNNFFIGYCSNSMTNIGFGNPMKIDFGNCEDEKKKMIMKLMASIKEDCTKKREISSITDCVPKMIDSYVENLNDEDRKKRNKDDMDSLYKSTGYVVEECYDDKAKELGLS